MKGNKDETPLTLDEIVDEITLIEKKVKYGKNSNQPTSSNDSKLIRATQLLVIATFVLAFVAGVQLIGTLKIADSNERMTNITEDFYEYHPPEVTLIDGSFAKLYAFKKNGSNTEISIVGIAFVYNSGLSDDIALIKKNTYSTSYLPLSPPKLILYAVNNVTGEIYSTTEILIPVNDTLFVEGNSFPIPVQPGTSAYIPIMLTVKSISDVPLNKTITLEIDHNHTQFEVLHPTTKKQISNFTACKTSIINYNISESVAYVTENTGREYIVSVRYTEDKEIYDEWKNNYLLQYGKGALVTV